MFSPRTNQTDYVEFISRDGNWATLGRGWHSSGPSIEYTSVGSVIHEVMHALTFTILMPRRQGPILLQLISETYKVGWKLTFQKSLTNSQTLAPDFTSIMHYYKGAFC
ncbi:MAG: hypothetical protein IPI22_15135 [Bacteroidetes bacterium]|nr:hypothetical protein [Bacteroidota bacterium]